MQSIKDYIGYPQELLNNTLIEDLYDGIEVTNNTFYQNSINMGKWSIKYSWSKLRDQIDKTDWKRHANPAVVNAYYSGIENSIQFPAGILQVIFEINWYKRTRTSEANGQNSNKMLIFKKSFLSPSIYEIIHLKLF